MGLANKNHQNGRSFSMSRFFQDSDAFSTRHKSGVRGLSVRLLPRAMEVELSDSKYVDEPTEISSLALVGDFGIDEHVDPSGRVGESPLGREGSLVGEASVPSYGWRAEPRDGSETAAFSSSGSPAFEKPAFETSPRESSPFETAGMSGHENSGPGEGSSNQEREGRAHGMSAPSAEEERLAELDQVDDDARAFLDQLKNITQQGAGASSSGQSLPSGGNESAEKKPAASAQSRHAIFDELTPLLQKAQTYEMGTHRVDRKRLDALAASVLARGGHEEREVTRPASPPVGSADPQGVGEDLDLDPAEVRNALAGIVSEEGRSSGAAKAPSRVPSKEAASSAPPPSDAASVDAGAAPETSEEAETPMTAEKAAGVEPARSGDAARVPTSGEGERR